MTDNIGFKVKELASNKHYLHLSNLVETFIPEDDNDQALLDSLRWALETIRRHVAFAIVVKENNPDIDVDTILLIPKNPPPIGDEEKPFKPQLRVVK